MVRIALVGFHNLQLMQFLFKYTDFLDSCNIEYDVIYWKRDSVYYQPKFSGNEIYFEYPTSNYTTKMKKIIGYVRCRRFFIKKIKEKKYDHIFVLTTQTAVMLSIILLTRYRKKYVYDFRDITYEKYCLYRKYIQFLIKQANFTAISSKGYLDILKIQENIYLSHNCNRLVSKNSHTVEYKGVLHIVFWGMIRQVKFNKAICDYFGNDERFLITYHGEGYYEELEKYCYEKKYINVTFTGSYLPEYIPSFVKDTHILMNLYENDDIQEKALTVKLYDGIRFKLPMLISKESYMSEYLKNNNFYYPFSFKEEDKDNIINWYESLSWETINQQFDVIINEIINDEIVLHDKILHFCKN